MRVLMTGGGTAGHVNPAIAIANTIKEYEPESEFAFVCSHLSSDKARDLVPRAGYERLYTVKICGMQAVYNPANIKTLYYMMTSPREAKKIITEFRPDVIIGTGGFACYPIVRAGAKMGIPTLLHESNAIAGKAILKLAPCVDTVMTNFESTLKDFSRAKHAIRVGNPVIKKNDTQQTGAYSGEYSQSVLIFGGSLGARYVNLAVAQVLCKIADKYPNVKFTHATGKRDHAMMSEKYSSLGLDKRSNVEMLDYIYDMAVRMERADLVVSRAGAMTISELALGGKAAILIPSPYVASNHQYINAKSLSDKGAAVLVREHRPSATMKESGVVSQLARDLEREMERLLDDADARRGMSEKIIDFAEPHSNEMIYKEIKKAIENK